MNMWLFTSSRVSCPPEIRARCCQRNVEREVNYDRLGLRERHAGTNLSLCGVPSRQVMWGE